MKSIDEMARAAISPGEQVCGCCEEHDGIWWSECDCGNYDDCAKAGAWCAEMNAVNCVAAALRELRESCAVECEELGHPRVAENIRKLGEPE